MAWWDSLFGSGGGGSSTGGGGGGTDWWGALWGGINSYATNREARDMTEDQIRQQGEQSRQNIGEQGRQGRLNEEFSTSLADYYRRLQGQERRGGLSNYGQFAANQYSNLTAPTPVGPVPTAYDFEQRQRQLGGG